VSLESRLRKLEQALLPPPPPRIAAAVVEQATGRVVQVLCDGPQGFEATPEGLTAADLPASCQVYPFAEDLTHLGCVNQWTGAAAVTVVRGIDLDVVMGKKPGLVAPFKSAPPQLEG
jgi:hypothetical protein